MKLVPLQRGMRLFCRRVVNLGGRKLQPGQELITTPIGPGALSWRRIHQLYEQRRVISESDPYFEELMQGPGLQNNPEFAKEWLEGGVEEAAEQKVQAPVIETAPVPAAEPAPSAPPAPPAVPQAPTATVEIVSLGGGWYDVIVNGEKINDKSLRKVEAEALVESHNG